MPRKKNLNYLLDDLDAEQKELLFFKLSEDPAVLEGVAERRKKAIELSTIGEYEDEAKIKYKNWGKMQGLSTGYKSLDDMTFGLVGGELTIIGGVTSHGKTQLAINIAYRVALQNVPVLFVTLEMTKPELTARVMKIAEPIPITSLPILYQVSNDMDWKDIEPLMANAKENGAKLVVIDHLHYFSRTIENTAQEIGMVTKQFKKNAIDHNLPVVLISHVRKLVGKQKIPTKNDLRDSSLIGQDADIVLMVYRDEKQEGHRQNVEIFNEKNRNRGQQHKYARLISYDGAKLVDQSEKDKAELDEAIQIFSDQKPYKD